MAYQSLYRRYRSRNFTEVLGQEHVTTALRNAVREDRVGHGYLFSGPRGTGKTSTARILAKVLNCEHPADGEPDATCPNCMSVEEGRSVDWLHELDAASNNGVEDMRDLLSRVAMGTSGNRKVYILDEVHMLSKAAANTLLKTLEEPPEHVVFVLATTEPEKVLPTIRSRTQHFDFKLLPADVLAAHVRHVIADAGLDLDDDVVDHVVRAGAGSARDTLSALDQVAAAGGVADTATHVADILGALGDRDAGAALVAVDGRIRSGQAPRVLADALIESLREAFLTAMGAPLGGLTDTAAAEASALASALGPATITAALESIGTAIVEMRHAPDPRIPLEVALVRLTRPDAGDVRALEARIERLEQQLAAGVPAAAPAGAPVADDRPAAAPEAAAGTPAEPTAAPAPGSRPPAGAPRGAAAARAQLAARARAGDHTPAETAADTPTSAGSRPSLGAVARQQAESPGTTPDPVDAPAGDPAPVASPAETAPTDSAPPSPTAAPVDPAPIDPAPTSAPATESAPTDPQPAPSAGPLDVAAVTSVWDDVIDGLKGRAKALFKPGVVAAVNGSQIALTMPNAAHAAQCEGKRDEVESALSTALGQRVVLAFDGDGGAGNAGGTPSAAHAGASAGPVGVPDDPVDDAVDLEDLRDAPDPDVGSVAVLKDAFPGAEWEDR